MANIPATNFQIGGSVSEHTSIYIKREADDQLFNALKQGELCYVLNSRQMGKSSLLLSVKSRLQAEGCICCFIDMSRVGSVNVSSEQWYAGVTSELWRGFQLGETDTMLQWWTSLGDITPAQKFAAVFQQQLLQHYPGQELIIFFDEVDSVLSLPFPADDFFSIIRACYNHRADDARMRNVGFAFFGVALPSDLISDKRRSPFNIGRSIALEGFTSSECQPLKAGLKDLQYDAQELLSAVFSWTRGQPFLTQKICQLIIDNCSENSPLSAKACVDNLVQTLVIANWESNDNPEHLRTIRDRMLLDDDYSIVNLAIYSQMLSSEGERLNVEDIDDYSRLYLTGLISVENGVIQPRTEVYRRVFDELWLQAQLDAVRPYAKQLQHWQFDNNEQWLLDEKDLQDAKRWSEGKHLPEIDHRFIAASQALVQRQVQDWNVRLQAEVEQRQLAEIELKDALNLLHEANRKTEQADRAKSDFLARVSREVRTPINSLMGLSHLALQRDSDDITSDYLQKIHRTTLYMLGVVNDMVDISKLERGEFSLQHETFLLDDVLDNLIDIAGARIVEKGLRLDLQLPDQIVPALAGDAMRLQQLLLNLLMNAIEFTERGSIELSVGIMELKESSLTLRFCLADSGCGISGQPVEGVIDKSAESVLRPGLGLSLCCELVSLMQGELYIKSHPDSGSRISFCATIGLAQQHVLDHSSPLRVALYADVTIGNTMQAHLALLGHASVQLPLASTDINSFDLDQYEKLVISIPALPTSRFLFDIVSQYPSLDIYPLVTAGSVPPRWLSTMHLQRQIQYPSSLNRLQTALHNQREIEQGHDFPGSFDQAYRILVAEDDEISQQIVRELLEQQGLEVTVVGNGYEALQALHDKHYDLLLLDIEMPVMGGLEVIEKLRALAPTSPQLATLPVIAMTAHALVSDRERFLAAGMNDHLSKPLEPSVLRELLNQWLPQPARSFVPPTAQSIIAGIDIADLEIDLSAGLERCSGNKQLYLKLLKDFANRYNTELRLEDLEFEELADLSHSIKGSAGSLGLARLASAAAELEASGRKQERPSESLLRDFRLLLARSCEQIQSLPPADNSSVSTEVIAPTGSRSNVTPDNSQNISKPRLLLVDTDIRGRKSLIDVLKQDYSVMVANTLERAFEIAGLEPQSQLALINISLDDDGDGLELCQRIRRLPNGNDICILLIGDTGSEEEAQRCLAAGANDVLQQPISQTLILERLSRHIRQIE
jgi:CheY-like chemotaxis protein/HPt (histidine-containing phosphotransfer) domain-containing protein